MSDLAFCLITLESEVTVSFAVLGLIAKMGFSVFHQHMMLIIGVVLKLACALDRTIRDQCLPFKSKKTLRHNVRRRTCLHKSLLALAEIQVFLYVAALFSKYKNFYLELNLRK